MAAESEATGRKAGPLLKGFIRQARSCPCLVGLRCLGALAGSVEGVGSAPASGSTSAVRSPQPPALSRAAAWAQAPCGGC